MKPIAFIGLGHMGQPMVQNLLAAGFSVRVYDINPAAVQEAVGQGAIAAASVAEAVRGADMVFTMLQTGAQVEKCCLGEQGIFLNATKNALYIDSSSIEITTSRALHKSAAAQGLAMIDAPVSGGVNGAKSRTLTFMVGGDPADFERAKPVLEKMGKKIIHAGPPGTGQAAKICNNLILGISMIAVSEGFALGTKLGLDPRTFFDISSHASGQCWSMTNYCPVPNMLPDAPASHGYKPGFPASMMLKDLRLAQHAAESAGAIVPLGAEAAEIYALFVGQGSGDIDFSGIFNLISGKITPQ